MKGNHWDTLWGVTAFGESHGPAVGLVIEDIKPGIDFPYDEIQKALDKRKPGSGEFTSARQEKDELVVLSGVFEGKTTGMPICMVVYNKGQRSEDYESLRDVFRPGHADLALFKKFKIYDYRGGGRISGRETIARVAAGSLVNKLLEPLEILIYPVSIGKVKALSIDLDFLRNNELSWPCPETCDSLYEYLQEIKRGGDSVGGIVRVLVNNVPGGLGDPVFEKLDANLSKAMVSIGGVKGIEFGAGFKLGEMLGSEANDPLTSLSSKGEPGNTGGISGGIAAEGSISFRFVVKPTPSISLPQKTIDREGKSQVIRLKGRFDTCLIPRIIPVVEAMIKLVLADALSYQKLVEGKTTTLDDLREAIDKIDEDILINFCRRERIVEQIAALKKKEKIAVHQPEREAEKIKELLRKSIILKIDPGFLEKIWQLIFEYSRAKQ